MKYLPLSIVWLAFLALSSCSKKTVPTADESKTKVAVPVKPAYKPIKTPVPKTIVVNDAAAKKDINGRYYYDLEGRRYWRNKKDGKYYLYYKGIFNNPAFQ